MAQPVCHGTVADRAAVVVRLRLRDPEGWLESDQDACHALLVAALAKRGVRKRAELTHGQARELIEAMEARLAAEPPFDLTPTAGLSPG